MSVLALQLLHAGLPVSRSRADHIAEHLVDLGVCSIDGLEGRAHVLPLSACRTELEPNEMQWLVQKAVEITRARRFGQGMKRNAAVMSAPPSSSLCVTADTLPIACTNILKNIHMR